MERNDTIIQRDNLNVIGNEILWILGALDKLLDLILGKLKLLTTRLEKRTTLYDPLFKSSRMLCADIMNNKKEWDLSPPIY